MNTITLNKIELKELINESVRENIIEILTDKKTYLEPLVLDAIEDIAFANAIEEGLNTKTIDKEEFIESLKKRI